MPQTVIREALKFDRRHRKVCATWSSTKVDAMRLHSSKILLGAILILALASCRSAPVYNVENMALSAPATATLDDVNRAIKQAGVGLGWAMKDIAPGHIEATLPIRAHVAVTDIRFDTKTFSITYKDSVNLHYDPAHNLIHKNYSSWVQNLQNAIVAQSSAI